MDGGGVIDADAPETRATVENLFAGLGIDPARLPVQATATPGHCQYFIRVSGEPPAHWKPNYRVLPTETTGPGELRYGAGAQCVVPCSIVDGRAYVFERGSPEWIPVSPVIRWAESDGPNSQTTPEGAVSSKRNWVSGGVRPRAW